MGHFPPSLVIKLPLYWHLQVWYRRRPSWHWFSPHRPMDGTSSLWIASNFGMGVGPPVDRWFTLHVYMQCGCRFDRVNSTCAPFRGQAVCFAEKEINKNQIILVIILIFRIMTANLKKIDIQAVCFAEKEINKNQIILVIILIFRIMTANLKKIKPEID